MYLSISLTDAQTIHRRPCLDLIYNTCLWALPFPNYSYSEHSPVDRERALGPTAGTFPA